MRYLIAALISMSIIGCQSRELTQEDKQYAKRVLQAAIYMETGYPIECELTSVNSTEKAGKYRATSRCSYKDAEINRVLMIRKDRDGEVSAYLLK